MQEYYDAMPAVVAVAAGVVAVVPADDVASDDGAVVADVFAAVAAVNA